MTIDPPAAEIFEEFCPLNLLLSLSISNKVEALKKYLVIYKPL
jgi:hypothetical protein